METRVVLLLLAALLCAGLLPWAATADSKPVFCIKSDLYKGPIRCNKTVDEIFTVDQFEAMFNHRNEPQAHAQGFWDYTSFIDAAKTFQEQGFAVTGGDDLQKRELAAFFAHVAHETTCGYSAAKDGPYAWGLCYKEELSPPKLYCVRSLLYPCALGASYHGRGAMPLYWNDNYGISGQALKYDLIHNPDLVANNATVAFQTAILRWMSPVKLNQPSAHDVMVNKWKPTKNDTDSFRFPGFGMTINILNGDLECGHGTDPRMEDRIAHYQYFLRILAPDADEGQNLDCGLQAILNLPTDARM
ncbi:hypothetical protein O6H91_14G002200 [Diphasiastrum complanatum]|uniref:Uncharacterized protein n=1 Tax=Diphasiastrum complanatum TaxID=34168 RepID=A0ACC2BKR6_DIPCM|nr:hypothetical protein O6H91_14G002200 [Diphasiastrum complanatum]